MKKWTIFLVLMFFLLSGFTYFQKDESTSDLNKACELLLANYARLTGIQERVVALKRVNGVPDSELETAMNEIKSQIRMISLESDNLFRKTISDLEKRGDETFNLYLMVKKMELTDNYDDVTVISRKIGNMLDAEEGKIPDDREVRYAFVRKLLSCFKNQKPPREIHVVCGNCKADEVEDIPEPIQEAVRTEKTDTEVNTVQEKMDNIDKVIARIREQETVKQTQEDLITYLDHPDYEKLATGKYVYEIATESGKFVYLAIDGKGSIPPEISSKQYLTARIKDTLKGEMFRLEEKSRKSRTQQEIMFGGVKYRFSPSLNKYVRIVNDQEKAQCENVVFQLIKSDHDSDVFVPESVGFGNLIAFSGGRVIKGVWLKESLQSSVKFYTTSGEDLALNPGRTWIEVLPEEVDIEYH